MSELELRKGLRAMLSGGLEQMDTDELNKLMDASSKILVDRKVPDKSANVKYLEKWISITEMFLESRISLRTARDQLSQLNEEYEGRISPNIKKTEVIELGISVIDPDGEDAQYYDQYEMDGWMPSDVTC